MKRMLNSDAGRISNLKGKKKEEGGVSTTVLCSGNRSEQPLIRHAGEGLMLLFISVAVTSSWVLLPVGFQS